HHLTNIVLMTLDVILLFLFLAGVTGRALRSAAVAALFAAHPISVESVAWVAERKAVLSIFFMLLTLVAYAWYARRPGLGRYLWVMVLFALALMSKIMIITLPFAMLLLDYWPLERLGRAGESGEARPWLASFLGLVKEKIPLFVMSAAAGWITLNIHRKEGALTA